MKKIFALILAVVLILGAVAIADTSVETKTGKPGDATIPITFTVADLVDGYSVEVPSAIAFTGNNREIKFDVTIKLDEGYNSTKYVVLYDAYIKSYASNETNDVAYLIADGEETRIPFSVYTDVDLDQKLLCGSGNGEFLRVTKDNGPEGTHTFIAKIDETEYANIADSLNAAATYAAGDLVFNFAQDEP